MIKLKNGKDYLFVGKNSNTAINVLLGYNENIRRVNEFDKFDVLMKTKSAIISIITDLSTLYSKKENSIWWRVINESHFVSGTVPIYVAHIENERINRDSLLEIICEQTESGVGIITIHPTATRALVESCKSRLIPITSRGGGIVVRDLLNKSEENIYIELLDKIISIAKKNDVAISIGATFRSGTIFDSYDETQKKEIEDQIKIAKYIEHAGVNVILETPGHADPRKLLQICERLKYTNLTIMPLGPMPTDIAIGEDDTAAVIGATLMGINSCADILSVVTSEEHTGNVPNIDSIIQAINKYEIAAHIIDLYKTNNQESDINVSKSRANAHSCLNRIPYECDRCGIFCPLKIEV